MSEETNRSESVKQCIELLDQIDIMLNEAHGIPLKRGTKIVDGDAMHDKLEIIRKIMPESVRAAKAIVDDADTIHAKAAEDVRAMRETARRDADKQLAEAAARVKKANDDAAAMTQQAQTALAGAQQQAAQVTQQAEQQARQILDQARYQAQQQAQQIIANAQLEADRLKSQEEVYIRAKVDAERITGETEAAMAQLRQQSYNYVEGMISQLEQYVGDVLADVHQEHQELLSGRK